MPRREFSLGRVLLIYLLGLVAGLQGALYLYDTFDDGVSDPLSGGIALAFVGAGLSVIAWSYRRGPA
jgi:hypothetical protein